MRPSEALAIDLRRIGLILLVAAYVFGTFFPSNVSWGEAAAVGGLGLVIWIGGIWLMGWHND